MRTTLAWLLAVLAAEPLLAQAKGFAELAIARALIAARYPEDRAVGYAPGDLRGAISVRVALPAAR